MKRIIDAVKNADRALYAIFFAALALRLIYIYQLQSSPFFNLPQIDMLWHHLWATEISKGDLLGKEVFFRAPLYPYFLALIYKLFGNGPIAYRIVQSIIGSFSCVLVYLIALRLFNRRTALIAGLIAAFYSILIYHDNELLLENLFVFLTLILFLLILKTKPDSPSRKFYWVGFALGLAAIDRPTILIFLPVLLYYLFFHLKRSSGKGKFRYEAAAILMAGLMTPILPVAVRNYAVGHDFVLIASQGGVNFWIGNNEKADGKTAGAPGRYEVYTEYQDNVKVTSKEVAEYDQKRSLKPSEISNYWYMKGFEFIVNHPLDFARLLITKIYFSWNAYEIESSRDLYAERRYSSLLAITLWHYIIGFPFGLMAPFSILGIYLAFQHFRRNFLLLGFLISYQLVLILYFVTSRFRVPTLPFLIILAAMAIDYLLSAKKKSKTLLIPLIIIAASLVIVNTTFFSITPKSSYRSNQAMAEAFIRQDRYDSALVYARIAVAENPNDLAGYAFLGTVYERLEDYAQAAEIYRKFLELNPRDAYVQRHLGASLYKLGDYQNALAASQNALKLDSTNIDIYTNLGNIYKELGQPQEAFKIMEKGYLIDSSDAAFLNNYAVALKEKGDYGKALHLWKRAVNLDSTYLPAVINLANLYFQAGQPIEAEREYLKALRLDADKLETNLNLAQLYLRTDRTPEGIALLQKVLEKSPTNPTALKLLQSAQGIKK